MTDKQPPTQVERVIRWFSNNRIVSILIIIGIIVIALGNFTDALSKISKFFGGSSNTETQRRKPVSLHRQTINLIMQDTHVNLESVQPAPDQMKIVPNQVVQVSAIANYEYPDWVDGMEISLKMNREPEDGRLWHSLVEKRVSEPVGRVQLSGLLPSVGAEDLNGRRVKVLAEMVIFDNTTGTHHVVARSTPVYFEVAE